MRLYSDQITSESSHEHRVSAHTHKRRSVTALVTVCFCPIFGLKLGISRGPSRAITGLMRCGKRHYYSITSSTMASSAGDNSRPSALAAVRLIISSYLVGCWNGRSRRVSSHARCDRRSRPRGGTPLCNQPRHVIALHDERRGVQSLNVGLLPSADGDRYLTLVL